MEPSTIKGRTFTIPRQGTNCPEEFFMNFVVWVNVNFPNNLCAKALDMMLIPTTGL